MPDGLNIQIDDRKIWDVIVRNTLDRPSKEFSSYSYYGMRSASLAQSLRQRTLGKSSEVTDDRMKQNPLGAYFAEVESSHIKLANSLSSAGGVLVLKSVGSTDIEGTMRAANQRLSLALCVPTNPGIETAGLDDEEKAAAYVFAHRHALEELAKLYDRGSSLADVPSSLRQDFSEMLAFLKNELDIASRLFGKNKSRWWQFWKT